MGFISQFVNSPNKASFTSTPNQGRRIWREIFGTNKEEIHSPEKKPVEGGSWGRSMVSSDAAFKRLLVAMRSLAPGGWSDDRWEQSVRHFVGIAYIAIHRIAIQWSQSEFQLFYKDTKHPDGKRPVFEDDPPQGDRFVKPYDLVRLLERPNRQDSFGNMMYRWAQQKYLTGTALSWMVPNEIGVPMELYPIPTAIAIPQPQVNPDYPDGYYRIQPIYPYGPFSSYPTPASAVGAPIPAQWMMKFGFPHPLLRYEGYSPLTGLRLSLDVIESIYRSRWYSMKRSINPSAVLNLTDVEGAQMLPLEEIERIRAEFEGAVQGTENAGQLFVSAPGSKLEQWGGKPIDMDYSSGWDQETGFCLAGFGITKPAAGLVEDSSYATLFATLKQLHILTLKPDVDDVASAMTRQLAPFFGDNLIVEIRCPRIDDHDVKNQKLGVLISGKAITKGELRKELDLPLFGDERDDEIAGEGEQPQQGMPGMEGAGAIPGMQGPEAEEAGPGEDRVSLATADEGMESADEEAIQGREEPEEITSSRPKPGNLGRGALGPRKSLNGKHKKKVHLGNGRFK